MKFKTVKELYREIETLRKRLNIIERDFPELKQKEISNAITEIQKWNIRHIEGDTGFELIGITDKPLEYGNHYFDNNITVCVTGTESDDMEIIIPFHPSNIGNIIDTFQIKNIMIDAAEKLYLENFVKNITHVLKLGE